MWTFVLLAQFIAIAFMAETIRRLREELSFSRGRNMDLSMDAQRQDEFLRGLQDDLAASQKVKRSCHNLIDDLTAELAASKKEVRELTAKLWDSIEERQELQDKLAVLCAQQDITPDDVDGDEAIWL